MENSYTKWLENKEEEKQVLSEESLDSIMKFVSIERFKEQQVKDECYAEDLIKLIIRAEDGLLATKILKKDYNISKLDIILNEEEGIVFKHGAQRII
jgi:hypothetical protein